MARSDFDSRDAYMQDLRRKVAQGDLDAAEQLEQEERRIDPIRATFALWNEERDVYALARYIHLRDPYGDSPEEFLPNDLRPAEMLALIQILSDEDEYGESHAAFTFDMAEALYQYCTEWHSGQWSPLYSIQSQLQFSPHSGWRNCYSNEQAFYIYQNLVNTEQRPEIPQPLENLPDDLTILYGTGNENAIIIQIGSMGPHYFLILNSSFEDALDEAAGWCEENAPGLLDEPEYELDENGNCIHCGANPTDDVCKHVEEAEADMTRCDGGLWIASWEWYGNEVDYDRAKATELAQANLTDNAPLPLWGLLWRCGGILELDNYNFEEAAEELDCEEDDLDVAGSWYLLGDEEYDPEEFGSYSAAVDEVLERYQIEEPDEPNEEPDAA
jgi:hypothetical protein